MEHRHWDSSPVRCNSHVSFFKKKIALYNYQQHKAVDISEKGMYISYGTWPTDAPTLNLCLNSSVAHCLTLNTKYLFVIFQVFVAVNNKTCVWYTMPYSLVLKNQEYHLGSGLILKGRITQWCKFSNNWGKQSMFWVANIYSIYIQFFHLP
jgi:hypothetical protein